MKRLKQQVKYVLQRVKQSRDNDNLLAWIIWQNRNPEAMKDLETFKVKFCLNEMPSVDTISRLRRQIQEQDETTRGLKYKERQLKQALIKKDLGYV
jgi:hypothetical protein